MCTLLRNKTIENKPSPILENEVEIDEVYVVSGHKGNSEAVKKNRQPRCRRLKGKRGRGTAAADKVPVLGMIQRDWSSCIKDA